MHYAANNPRSQPALTKENSNDHIFTEQTSKIKPAQLIQARVGYPLVYKIMARAGHRHYCVCLHACLRAGRVVRAMRKPPAVVVVNLLCGLALGLSASAIIFNRETLALQKNHTSELNLLVLQTRVALDLIKQGRQEMGELMCLKLAVHRTKGKL